MKKLKILSLCSVISIMLVSVSCSKTGEKPVAPQFIFKHNVNGYELQKGSQIYTNLAGNLYQVDELKYFISEVSIKTTDGQILPIESDNAIHYVDIQDTASLTWSPKDRLQVTGYESISFVFGINETKNKTGLFVNAPESNMSWPDMMGGGYHYMQMNGQWVATGNTVKAFNLHLGIGTNGTDFYQNYFTVTIPLNIMAGNLSNVFTITMNIEKWFSSPNLWDWNVIGGQIMQNQEAMHKACQNGANVFDVSHKGENIVYHD